jgi:hypothetical protein
MNSYRIRRHVRKATFVPRLEALEDRCTPSCTVNAQAESLGGTHTCYVAKDGSDSNPGTKNAPFLTIKKAVSVAAPGDTVFVRPGTYHETVTPEPGAPGLPITYVGERGPHGEWLTVIDPTVAIDPKVTPWQPSKVGADVWETSLGYNPGTIIYNGQSLARLGGDPLVPDPLLGFTILACPVDQKVKSNFPADQGVSVKFWDLTYAVFGYNASTGVTYIRFKDGSDPNALALRAASITNRNWTYGINADGASYVSFRDFEIQGAYVSVRIWNAHDTTFIDNHFMHGLYRLIISGTPAANMVYNTVIRGNKMELNLYGYNNTGAYYNGTSDGSAPYDLGLKEYFYTFFKYVVGQNNTADIDIWCGYAGANNVIEENEFSNGAEAIFVHSSKDVEIRGNYFHDLSDDGILSSSAEQALYPDQEIGVSIHDNTFFNCARGIRFGSIDVAGADKINNHFIYRNTFFNPSRLGTHLQMHYLYPSCPPDNPDCAPASQASSLHLYVYHNSFGSSFATTIWGGYPHARGGIPNAQFINNVFSNNLWLKWVGNSAELGPWKTDPSMIKVFSHNWMGDVGQGIGQEAWGGPAAWMDETNIMHQGVEIWSATEEPDWLLPLKSDARQAGIDLSVPYTINNVTYPPLPGMEVGYYTGSAPDMGAMIGDNDLGVTARPLGCHGEVRLTGHEFPVGIEALGGPLNPLLEHRPLAADPHAAHVQHRLRPRPRPVHPGALHLVLDQVAAGPFDHATRDG